MIIMAVRLILLSINILTERGVEVSALKVVRRKGVARELRVDEALERLIAYIDDAIMVNAGEVVILHGTGTGALKQLTRDY
ncbi:MAG: Smr/MutS family protein, partial [Clostridia bacterium]|nr:Smr/MutS family protein [Clostridia bacterium]